MKYQPGDKVVAVDYVVIEVGVVPVILAHKDQQLVIVSGGPDLWRVFTLVEPNIRFYCYDDQIRPLSENTNEIPTG